jgi:alanine racemase
MVRHSSHIELSRSSFRKNVNFLRKQIGEDVRISSVVKANAYGHGIETFVPLAELCGLDHFATASSFEAEEVLKVCSDTSRIMIMGILYDEDIPWAIEHDIEFYIFNDDRLKLVTELTKDQNKPAHVHLEVETGANRTGMDEKQFRRALRHIKASKGMLIFEGLCTHFGGAENFSNRFKINHQLKRFKTYESLCKRAGLKPRYRHLASSAAALAYPESRYDMVRIGVAQYGYWPGPDIYYHYQRHHPGKKTANLHRILSWKTNVMDIKHVSSGEFIGYGTYYQAHSDMTIAVLPLGYSNGYPRGLSDRGHVLIHGKRAPITGLVNMNLFMADISHIPQCKVGDEVVLIGRQNHNTIHVASFTQSTHLINQELLSRLPAAIPRKVVR